jgi:hypothetical protein
MAITAIQATPGSGMTLDIGRIAPVPDRLKYAPSNGAQHLEYLRALAEHLEYEAYLWRSMPRSDYDRKCYDVAWALRLHGSYLIQVGCA